MNNKALLYLFSLVFYPLAAMEQPQAAEDVVKFHVFNKLELKTVELKVLKYYIFKSTNCLASDSLVWNYKTQHFILHPHESCTFNMRPDSCGVINLFSSQSASSEPDSCDSQDADDLQPALLRVVYSWNDSSESLRAHVLQKFTDCKMIAVNRAELINPPALAFVVQGSNMHDSFLYYENMPEGD